MARLRRTALPQRDCHSSQTKGNLKAGLNPAQPENHAIAVPHGGHLTAGDESSSGAHASITARYRCRTPQIAGSAAQVHRRDPEAADADSTDRQAIGPTVVEKHSVAPRRADDEARLDDVQTDAACRLRPRSCG